VAGDTESKSEIEYLLLAPDALMNVQRVDVWWKAPVIKCLQRRFQDLAASAKGNEDNKINWVQVMLSSPQSSPQAATRSVQDQDQDQQEPEVELKEILRNPLMFISSSGRKLAQMTLALHSILEVGDWSALKLWSASNWAKDEVDLLLATYGSAIVTLLPPHVASTFIGSDQALNRLAHAKCLQMRLVEEQILRPPPSQAKQNSVLWLEHCWPVNNRVFFTEQRKADCAATGVSVWKYAMSRVASLANEMEMTRARSSRARGGHDAIADGEVDVVVAIAGRRPEVPARLVTIEDLPANMRLGALLDLLYQSHACPRTSFYATNSASSTRWPDWTEANELLHMPSLIPLLTLHRATSDLELADLCEVNTDPNRNSGNTVRLAFVHKIHAQLGKVGLVLSSSLNLRAIRSLSLLHRREQLEQVEGQQIGTGAGGGIGQWHTLYSALARDEAKCLGDCPAPVRVMMEEEGAMKVSIAKEDRGDFKRVQTKTTTTRVQFDEKALFEQQHALWKALVSYIQRRGKLPSVMFYPEVSRIPLLVCLTEQQEQEIQNRGAGGVENNVLEQNLEFVINAILQQMEQIAPPSPAPAPLPAVVIRPSTTTEDQEKEGLAPSLPPLPSKPAVYLGGKRLSEETSPEPVPMPSKPVMFMGGSRLTEEGEGETASAVDAADSKRPPPNQSSAPSSAPSSAAPVWTRDVLKEIAVDAMMKLHSPSVTFSAMQAYAKPEVNIAQDVQDVKRVLLTLIVALNAALRCALKRESDPGAAAAPPYVSLFLDPKLDSKLRLMLAYLVAPTSGEWSSELMAYNAQFDENKEAIDVLVGLQTDVPALAKSYTDPATGEEMLGLSQVIATWKRHVHAVSENTSEAARAVLAHDAVHLHLLPPGGMRCNCFAQGFPASLCTVFVVPARW